MLEYVISKKFNCAELKIFLQEYNFLVLAKICKDFLTLKTCKILKHKESACIERVSKK